MKKILITSLLSLSLFTSQAVAVPSQGYTLLKGMVSSVLENQNSIDMYRLFINESLNDVNRECSTILDDTDCVVHNEIIIQVTPQMATLSQGSLTAGQNITFADGALTYKNISTGKYNHSIKVTVNKIKINGTFVPDSTVELFRWTDSGIDKAISYVGSDFIGTFNEKFAQTIINGANTFIGSGTFTESAINSTFKYKAKLQQYDPATNGIKISMTVDTLLAGGIDNSFTIIAKANDTGGYIKTKFKDNTSNDVFEEEETFNGNGQRTGLQSQLNGGGWMVENAVVAGGYDVTESDLDSSVTVGVDSPANPSTTSVTYVVVKSGVTPSEETVIGFGDFFDNNGDAAITSDELHFDYFGDSSYLAVTGALTDSDQLDVYNINDISNPVQVTGIYLTE